MSLFTQFSLRKMEESSLYSIFQPCTGDAIEKNKCHIIDGGFLLDQVHWAEGSTYNDVLEGYIAYIQRNFQHNHSVWWIQEHCWKYKSSRAKKTLRVESKEVLFKDTLNLTVSQEVFQANINNEVRLIKALTQWLRNVEIPVRQWEGDAHLLIVRTAMDTAQERPEAQVYVAREDVDLLVLLIYNSSSAYDVKLLKPGRVTGKKTRLWFIVREKSRLHSQILKMLYCSFTPSQVGFGIWSSPV